MQNGGNLGKISLVAGLLGLVLVVVSIFTWLGILCYVGIGLGVIGLILAIMGGKKGEKTTAGLVLAILALAIGIIIAIACSSAFYLRGVADNAMGMVSDLADQMNL